tara:strand:+ start:9833 stop:10324 length:492 start_codon:yes stop_codon:yes gene_type:complete
MVSTGRSCVICHKEITIPELPTIHYDGGAAHPSCYYGHRDWQQDVAAFHQRFGIPIRFKPQLASSDRRHLRTKLHREEYEELWEAMSSGNITEIADGIADLIYVLLGTAIEYGININPIWDEVQRTNMLKEGGGIRPDGKILKPEGWLSPDIAGILKQQGWKG